MREFAQREKENRASQNDRTIYTKACNDEALDSEDGVACFRWFLEGKWKGNRNQMPKD